MNARNNDPRIINLNALRAASDAACNRMDAASEALRQSEPWDPTTEEITGEPDAELQSRLVAELKSATEAAQVALNAFQTEDRRLARELAANREWHLL